MIEIKVRDEPKQKFSLILNNQRVTMTLWYNQSQDRWNFDLARDGEPILRGRRIVTGVDLLAPFGLGLGVLFAHSDTGVLPTRANLPNGLVKLYHTTEAEIRANRESFPL